MIKTIKNPEESEWTNLIQRPAVNQKDLFEIAENIFKDVQQNGDKAVSKYSEKFDGVHYNFSPLGLHVIEDAKKEVSATLQESIRQAFRNILKFHASQSEFVIRLKQLQVLPVGAKVVPLRKWVSIFLEVQLLFFQPCLCWEFLH